MSEPDLLPPAAAADYLGLTPETLRRMAVRGDLHAVRTPGGHHRYPRAELDRLIHRPDDTDR